MRLLTTMFEFLREPMGVVGRELSVGLVLNSSELRLSEPSLRPLLMELLSSQLQERTKKRDTSGDIHTVIHTVIITLCNEGVYTHQQLLKQLYIAVYYLITKYLDVLDEKEGRRKTSLNN